MLIDGGEKAAALGKTGLPRLAFWGNTRVCQPYYNGLLLYKMAKAPIRSAEKAMPLRGWLCLLPIGGHPCHTCRTEDRIVGPGARRAGAAIQSRFGGVSVQGHMSSHIRGAGCSISKPRWQWRAEPQESEKHSSYKRLIRPRECISMDSIAAIRLAALVRGVDDLSKLSDVNRTGLQRLSISGLSHLLQCTSAG